jgi:hypothetical protein
VHPHAVNFGQTTCQTVPVFLLSIDKDFTCIGYAQNDEPVIVIIFAAGRG